MPPVYLVFVLLALSSLAYYIGRKRAFAAAGSGAHTKILHSRPTYYGMLTALWCGIPALLLFGFWLAFETRIITALVVADLPEEIRNLPADRLNLIINDIRNLVSGNIVSGQIDQAMQAAADHYRHITTISHVALAIVAIAIAAAGALLVCMKITPRMRARNRVEQRTQDAQ